MRLFSRTPKSQEQHSIDYYKGQVESLEKEIVRLTAERDDLLDRLTAQSHSQYKMLKTPGVLPDKKEPELPPDMQMIVDEMGEEFLCQRT